MAEFEEKSNGKEIVSIDTCERVCGVGRSGNKWRARVHHPKLKFNIHIGHYDTQEEAVLAVKKKKTEFQEMFNGDDFEGRRLPYGVRRRGYRSWATRIYHPGLKRKVSLGSYNTPEKAAIVVRNKRAEFLKMYGWRPNAKYDTENDDKLLEGSKSYCEVEDEMTGDIDMPAFVRELKARIKRDCKFDDEKQMSHLKIPCGVRKMRSGRWYARISGPVPKSRIWLGTFDNAEDAVRCYNKGKAELAVMIENANKGPINRFPTSVLGSDYLNNICITDKSNSAGVGERSMIGQKSGCVSEFDEAVRLGFINEYGQLMGMYSELDRQMEFSLPEEDVADMGVY